ncbi:hypothetical protein PCANC_08865 [Puccinia coronata f. sp. avenae]|uniref:JmjC domain-containing protein n=1 Tax=Puccinia coronata f. sp. avenae TaxID=200324 RepID=A0A2N5VS85_9BASI|nr:hypothetical protein PCANC_08865 [Puccinia coronata f. sp. avenae]
MESHAQNSQSGSAERIPNTDAGIRAAAETDSARTEDSRAERSLQELVHEYQELNASDIQEIAGRLPTALELSRSVASNRPLVIRAYAQLQRAAASSAKDGLYHNLEGLDKWSASYLVHQMGQQLVTVARTPSGRADSVVDGKYFVEPAYEKIKMADFLGELHASERTSISLDHDRRTRDVVYLQSQDGNLSKELLPLLPDLGSHVPLASQALGTDQPDAVNLWIGDERSVTSLHNDPYENFYMMIEGSKTFTLFPPVECYCMHEAEYRSSQYLWDESEHAWKIVSKTQGEEQMQVPWIPVDPLEPNYAKHPRFRFARSMSVQLDQGDLLYLPSLWYHHVQAHRTSPNGLVIACNWWYDMNYEGAHYALFSFIRRHVLALDQADQSKEKPEGTRSNNHYSDPAIKHMLT